MFLLAHASGLLMVSQVRGTISRIREASRTLVYRWIRVWLGGILEIRSGDSQRLSSLEKAQVAGSEDQVGILKQPS